MIPDGDVACLALQKSPLFCVNVGNRLTAEFLGMFPPQSAVSNEVKPSPIDKCVRIHAARLLL